MEVWYEIFGENAEIPKMLFFECPLEVLEKRIMGRAKYTGREDDNLESIRLRFDTFKNQTLPIVEHFRAQGKCFEVDTSQGRQAVYAVVKGALAEFTDPVVV